MLHLFQALSRLLANYTSIFVIGVAVFTFFFPHTFDWVRGITQTVILGIIMLTMGLTLTTNDFKILAQRPLDVFIGACAQFIIMPGVAYLLVHVWHLDPALALGILLVGCPDFPKAPYTTLATKGLLLSSVKPCPRRP